VLIDLCSFIVIIADARYEIVDVYYCHWILSFQWLGLVLNVLNDIKKTNSICHFMLFYVFFF
jgi:hypothetical protein